MSIRSTATAWQRGLTHLLLALILGAVAGGVAAVLMHHQRGSAADVGFRAPSSDRIDEAVAALQRDHVYVAPDGRPILDAAGEQVVQRAAEQGVGDESVPVYVVVWAPDAEIGMSPLQSGEAVAQGLDLDRGVLYVWEGPAQGDVVVLGPGGYVPGVDALTSFVGDPAVTLPKLIRRARSVDYFGDGGGSDYWGGVGGGTAAGALIGLGVLFALWILGLVASAASGRRPLLPGRWRWREEPRG